MRHLRSDWDGIQDTNQHWPEGSPNGCSSIGWDEPVFLLRAKDPAAAATVMGWAAEVGRQGGDPALIRRVEDWAYEMDRWRREHYPNATVADVPEGKLK